jgi:hypothetical protein
MGVAVSAGSSVAVASTSVGVAVGVGEIVGVGGRLVAVSVGTSTTTTGGRESIGGVGVADGLLAHAASSTIIMPIPIPRIIILSCIRRR